MPYSFNDLIEKIYQTLYNEYGPQGWWPMGGVYFPKQVDKYEIILGAVLTQNTSWENVERAFKNLRDDNLLTPEEIIGIETDRLSHTILPSGYYNQKARRLKEVSTFYLEHLKSNTPPTREELLRVKGIGYETADSILLYAYQIPIFVVDMYTRRIFTRIGPVKEKDTYQEIQNLFMGSLPEDEKLYNEYHALIVKHGKEICKRKPFCSQCILRKKGICLYRSSLKG